jgi:hypothetical protein
MANSDIGSYNAARKTGERRSTYFLTEKAHSINLAFASKYHRDLHDKPSFLLPFYFSFPFLVSSSLPYCLML